MNIRIYHECEGGIEKSRPDDHSFASYLFPCWNHILAFVPFFVRNKCPNTHVHKKDWAGLVLYGGSSIIQLNFSPVSPGSRHVLNI